MTFEVDLTKPLPDDAAGGSGEPKKFSLPQGYEARYTDFPGHYKARWEIFCFRYRIFCSRVGVWPRSGGWSFFRGIYQNTRICTTLWITDTTLIKVLFAKYRRP